MIRPSGTASSLFPIPGLCSRSTFRRRAHYSRVAGILRPIFAPAQRPYKPTLLAFDGSVELQGGQPAEHLRDRKLKLPGDLGGVQGENIREVGKDAVALGTERDPDAGGGGPRGVPRLPPPRERGQPRPGGPGQPGPAPDPPLGAPPERRRNASP